MKPGKRDIDKIAKAMDGDYDTLEEAAKAVTEVAFEVYEKKAQWITVGQVFYPTDDPEYGRISFGPFTTRGQAEKVGQKLAVSSATNEMARWVAVPYWGDTPAAWYNERKRNKKAVEQIEDDDTPLRELRHQMQVEWFTAHPGETELPEHLKGNGWEDLDVFEAWYEDHVGECPSCEGTGKIPGM